MTDHDVAAAPVGHAISLITMLGTMVGVLPMIMGVPAMIFYMIQVYETKTCKTFFAWVWHFFKSTQQD